MKEIVLEFFLFSGMPVMECCRFDDYTSSEHTGVGISPGWVDTDVSRLCFSINSSRPRGTWAPSRSPPVAWWSKWCSNCLEAECAVWSEKRNCTYIVNMSSKLSVYHVSPHRADWHENVHNGSNRFILVTCVAKESRLTITWCMFW